MTEYAMGTIIQYNSSNTYIVLGPNTIWGNRDDGDSLILIGLWGIDNVRLGWELTRVVDKAYKVIGIKPFSELFKELYTLDDFLANPELVKLIAYSWHEHCFDYKQEAKASEGG